MTAVTTIAALCVVSLTGCTVFTPVDTDTKQYALSTIPGDLPTERTHAATLLVLVPETAPAYATPRMAYTTRKYEIAYFSQNAWAETPAQMILPLIVETFRRTRYFSAVTSPPYFGRFTFLLRTEIIELEQDFTSDPAVLRLTVRFDLMRGTTNQQIAEKEFSVQEPLSERNPYAGVEAANGAVGRLLRELSTFVLKNAH
ncbi:cholesterol transport system auxiliary component [Paraburkholderia sacchari]|uniref:ABC-type transport auxiliary lipoprotein family protein n=1 Tax=Paraburkholderia sacchari TaxID=159450 RepID=UPI0039A448EB